MFPCRLHGDEVRRGDAADVRGVLHPQVVWWRQIVLVRFLRVRQDDAEGEDAASFLSLFSAFLPVFHLISVLFTDEFYISLLHFRMDLHQLNFSWREPEAEHRSL